ncbi:putative quinol monooxygenase [Reyranella sp. CPCC 100927]|uniref:putative quinol monooxygenase n=1 Tax=Reyranella sp. CPCC 100927 TaxID=2599616 RepID=UPI0011B7336E|nr:antibiotic biosynthesis monooxygenase family protein [Reyranella sp. CPCC 100927]TWT11391.1 antibiotic biosynthesis monooxygenase [Reyranella sp. CPCC 100927]
MITITAILRARKGTETTLHQALLAVAANVARDEPDTIDFFIAQGRDDPTIFTTYERFTDEAAMDRHNGSDAVAAFFKVAAPILDGDVILHTCREVSTKR